MTTSVPIAFFIWNLDKILNIYAGLASDVKILFALVLVRYYVSLIASTMEIGAFIRDRYATLAQCKIFSSAIQVGIIFVLYGAVGRKVYYVGIAALAYDIVNLCLQYFFKRRYTPNLKVDYTKFSFSSIAQLFTNGIWIAINNVGNILNNGLDLLISNLMISEVVMGQISVAKTISSLNYSIVSGISESFKAKQLKLYSLGKTHELIDELKYAMKITGTVFLVISGVFISCGQDLLFLWMRKQDVKTIYYLLVICVLSDFMPSLVKPLYYVYTLTTKMRIPCYVTIAMGTMNVISMFLLLKCTSFGGYAVVLTTFVINTIHVVDAPLYSAHCLEVKLSTFYNVVAVYVVAFAFNMVMCRLGIRIIPFPVSWGMLIVKAVISVLISVIISVCIMFTRDEKRELYKSMKG